MMEEISEKNAMKCGNIVNIHILFGQITRINEIKSIIYTTHTHSETQQEHTDI